MESRHVRGSAKLVRLIALRRHGRVYPASNLARDSGRDHARSKVKRVFGVFGRNDLEEACNDHSRPERGIGVDRTEFRHGLVFLREISAIGRRSGTAANERSNVSNALCCGFLVFFQAVESRLKSFGVGGKGHCKTFLFAGIVPSGRVERLS